MRLPAALGRLTVTFVTPTSGADDTRRRRPGERFDVVVAAPSTIAAALGRAMQMPSIPPGRVSWRCVGGKPWGCAVGANVPCDPEADPRARYALAPAA